jgi:hypothetical protein
VFPIAKGIVRRENGTDEPEKLREKSGTHAMQKISAMAI